jgi:hypothetical protein
VDLERGPLSLVSTIEELLGRKSSGCGLENREYGRKDPSRWPRGTLHSQTLALISQPTNGGRLVGIVHSRTQATERDTAIMPYFLHNFQICWTELFLCVILCIYYVEVRIYLGRLNYITSIGTNRAHPANFPYDSVVFSPDFLYSFNFSLKKWDLQILLKRRLHLIALFSVRVYHG